jgi:hypothetical protein
MRSVALWILGAWAAFLTTAGAFLLLASLGSDQAASDLIPQAESSESKYPNSALELKLPKARLEGLKRGPGQELTVDVQNESDEELSNVDLALEVVSENTAQPHARYYRGTVERLGPKEITSVEFEIDLSPLPTESPGDGQGAAEQPREILEIKAITEDDISAVKTAILAP